MGRHHRWRRISYLPPVTLFKPSGQPPAGLEEVRLLIEEAEAIRLKDLEGLEQEEAAAKMNISRTTYSRVLDSGRRKVADALMNGKSIRIEGGNYEMAERRYRCISGHEWNEPFENLVDGLPEKCPECDTPSIMPLFPPGMRRGAGRGRGEYRGRQRGRGTL